MHDHILDALRRGATDEALNAARDAVASHPDDAQAHRLLAVAQQQAGDKAPALASIERAIALEPEVAELHLLRAGLLLGGRQLDEAQAALARSTGLDPNQFPAYILQAQLALGRGDLAEAERLARTAERVAPGHPQIHALEGTLALRRGDVDRALAILGNALEHAPDEPQLRHALGFAYLAKGHLAFAEQAFRGLLEQDPGSTSLRALLADLLRRQGRPADAADMLAPLLEQVDATPTLRRMVGELEVEAGRHARALPPLRAALAAMPDDRRTLQALMEAWRRQGDADDARNTLDAALATHPQTVDLWRARLALEPFADGQARTLVERWHAAMPDCVPALEALSRIHDAAGDRAQAEALARRIVELDPTHVRAGMRLLHELTERDPEAALTRIEQRLAQAEESSVRRELGQMLGHLLDGLGRHSAAAEAWTTLQAEMAPRRLQLPPATDPRVQWPALAPFDPAAPGVVLLWGAPGSGVERLAATFAAAGAPLRADRFAPKPPDDPLRHYRTASELRNGEVAAGQVVSSWRAQLPARGVNDGQVIDWLLWWDNALLLALRPQLPEGVLMIALRDPRDMLLDWLAYGAVAPFSIETPTEAAAWLARLLEQVALLQEQDLYPHRLIRLDAIADDPQALAAAIGEALEIPMPPPPPTALGPRHFAAGHWRAYAQALAGPFALLTPVALRLGYAED